MGSDVEEDGLVAARSSSRELQDHISRRALRNTLRPELPAKKKYLVEAERERGGGEMSMNGEADRAVR